MWWDSLSDLQQMSFVIAVVATILMVLLIVLMLIGIDSGEGFDGDISMEFDIDGDLEGVDAFNSESLFSIGGLKILTLRGALAFMSVGGWMTYALAGSMPNWMAVLIGLLSGCVSAVLFAMAMRAIYRLESSGNLDYRSAIGKTASVYIRIPKNNDGKGKVMMNHQGRLVEVDAVTKGEEDILPKQEVLITALMNETTVVVQNIKGENK